MNSEGCNPRLARAYPGAVARADRRGAAEHRRRLVDGLAGHVIEVGAGNGRNFVHYPPTVTEIVGDEAGADPAGARRRLPRRAGCPSRSSPASRTPCRSRTASTRRIAAVASLVLCSVPDQARALWGNCGACCGPAASCASTSMYSRGASRSGCSGAWPTAPASGRRSLAAAISRARRRARSPRRGSPSSTTASGSSCAPGAIEPRLTYVLGSARR